MITEDPSVYLADFGLPVVAGAVTGAGILDLNSEIILGGEAVMIDYLLTVPTASFGFLAYGDTIQIDGANYKVESQPLRVDDGTWCRVPLMKMDPGDPVHPPIPPTPAGQQLVRIDSSSTANTVYVGKAPNGSAESAAVWAITRFVFSAAGVETSSSTITAATWTGRTGHTYP